MRFSKWHALADCPWRVAFHGDLLAILAGVTSATALAHSSSTPIEACVRAIAIGIERPDGEDVSRLPAGDYTINVHDLGSRLAFHLVGPGVDRTTTTAFVGTQTWHVRLRQGSYRYYSDARHPKLRGRLLVAAPHTSG
jgi:hypothetical protein